MTEALEPEAAEPCIFVEEKNSSEVISAWKSSLGPITTSTVAYAELLTAVYRKAAETRLNKTHFENVVGLFQEDWSSFIILELTTV